ncbi:MAG TPA: alpha/beta fold hydrolase [Vicinamibacterales bacterium]|jgi:alpha-beta hydrolase superfamily lysophospholipase|nr:alpha/beta fold hydrolase [Vicinamibacterales bacterium]
MRLTVRLRPLACAAMAAALAVGVSAQVGPAEPPRHFTVASDGHPLAVWARIPPAPRAVVLLLHGRTWSSLPDFDLQVPGMRRSVLDSLQAKGIAAYALDARGYGATPRDATGWLTPNRAAADVATVLKWVAARHPGLPRPALVGWSLGAATAHLAAVRSASGMSSLVLFGYAPDPDGDIAPDTDAGPPLRARTTAEAAVSDFISPKVTPSIVVKSFVEAALKTDPVAADWRHEDQFIYDSSRISVPTLVLFGERDPGVDESAAERFVARLKTKDKRLVIIPAADHCAHLEDTHDAWINEVVNFVTRFH